VWALPEADKLWKNTGFVVTGRLVDVAIAPDGQSLAAASLEGGVYVWNLASGTRRLTLDQPAQVVQTAGVAFGPDGETLLSVGDSIRQWTLPEGTLIRQVVLTTVERSYSADLEYVRWVLASTQDGPVILVTRDEVLDIRRGRDLQTTVSLRCVTASGSSPLALSPDGRLLAAWRSGRLEDCDDIQPGLALLDAATGSLVVSAEGGLEGYWPLLAFSPDGSLLALAGTSLDLRRTSDLALVKSLGLANQEIELTSLAFAPDGETLAAGMRDGGIWMWEVSTGDELAWLEGHTLSVTGLAFTPDGRGLVSSSEDGTLRLWGVP
jgi:WD40 repeat protein